MSDDDKVVAASSVGPDSDDDSVDHKHSRGNGQPPPNLVQTVIFKLPPPVDTAAKRRTKQRRTRTQVQRIMGWYPSTAIEEMMQVDQSAIDVVARDRAARKVNDVLELQRALQRRNHQTDNVDGGTPQHSPARGPSPPPSVPPMPSSSVTPPHRTLPPAAAADDVVLKALATEAAALEAKLALLEHRDITSSTSTIEYTLHSAAPSDFNFAPMSTHRQQLSGLLSPSSPSSPHDLLDHFQRHNVPNPQRFLSNNLRDLYRQVAMVPANDDSFADKRERDRYLEAHRYHVRATDSAIRIQTAWRMHRSRAVFCRWRATKHRKQRRVLQAWMLFHSINKRVRTRLCRRAFTEWAEEVECNIKLRLIELKLLQHSSTLYKLPTIVKNLFVTNSRADEWLDGPQSLERRARTASTRTVLFVDQAFASVEDRSGDRTCNRIYELRIEMERARQAVARKFVQTTFLHWKATHEAHSRVVVNAEMCLRRAFRMAFMKRPAWVGERVLVAYQMWYRYTVFRRHKRQCLEVPVFTAPLTQWDQWIKAYRDEQIRILEAQAKGPLAWMRRYFHLLIRFWRQRKAKKRNNIKAKLHYQRRMLAGLFESWHRDTLANLETRGRLKQVFHGWRFYALQKQHCRPQKRRVAIKSKQRQTARSWEAWKEVLARHEMTELDRHSKLLQPQVYPKMCQVLFYWAQVASQRTKHHVFQRWKASLLQRKNFAKLWCTSASLSAQSLVRTTFLALRSAVTRSAAVPPRPLQLAPDPDAILDALERAFPYMHSCETRVDVEPYSLYSFHMAVRDGHVAAMEAMMQHDPTLVHGREPVYGNTALHVAVNRSDKHLGWFHQREVLGALLAYGASAFAVNHRGQSALLATSDLHMRHYMQSNGYGFNASNSPACIRVHDANTTPIWHTLALMLTQVNADERKLGHACLGTWHSFIPSAAPPPPPGREDTAGRVPFLYVMANKLLNRKRVQAVKVRVGLMVASSRRSTHSMLLHDRRVFPDECRLDWVAGGDGGVAAVDVHLDASDVTPFHATHYFGKDTTSALETHLATDFVQHLMAKPSLELKSVENEVKALDTMVRATENQLLQLERHGARKLQGGGGGDEPTKAFASIDEEILHVQHSRAWTELRIAVKLAHPQPPTPASPDEATVIAALQTDLPSETDVLIKLDEMIAHQKKCVDDVQTVVDTSRTEFQAHQEQYTQLLDLYSGEAADNMYSQLVTTRLAVDEHKVAFQSAEKKLRKHQAKLEQLETVLKLYSGPIDEQRTYTQEEYATLSGLLHLHQHTYDQLAQTRSKLETRFKDLDQESLEQPAQANLDRANHKTFRTVAKRLLVQHQVLTQMRRSSSALLDLKQHKWFIRSTPPEYFGTVDETLAGRPPDVGAMTKVAASNVVRSGLQQTLDDDKAVSSTLVHAYRRSIMLLFDAERQMVAAVMDAKRRAEVESQESFVEINPLTGQVDPPPSMAVMVDGRTPAPHAATADEVGRLDRARRRGTLIVPSADAPQSNAEKGDALRVNKTRETLRRILLTRGNDETDSETSASVGFFDGDDMPSLQLDDADDKSRRRIWGSRFEFANFTVASDSEDASIVAPPGSSRIPQSARGGPMALWKADGVVGSNPAAALSFLNKNVHEKQVTHTTSQQSSPPRANANVPPMQRAASTRSPVRLRHSSVEAIPDRDDQRTRRRMSCAAPAVASNTTDASASEPTVPPLELDGAAIKATPLPSTRTRRNITSRSELVHDMEIGTTESPSRGESPQVSARESVESNAVSAAAITDSAAQSTEVPSDTQQGEPPQTATTIPTTELDAALDDVDVLLDNFTTFSQSLLRQYMANDPAAQPLPPHESPTLRPRAVHNANSTPVPLRSMDDILHPDESFRLRRPKTKQKYPKRNTAAPNALPSLADTASLSLTGKSSALRPSNSMPRLAKAPRYIPAPDRTGATDATPLDNQVYSVAEDEWSRIPLIELQLYQDVPKSNKLATPSLANGQPAKQHITTRDERPFLKGVDQPTPVPDTSPSPQTMGLVGTRLQREQHSQSMPALLPQVQVALFIACIAFGMLNLPLQRPFRRRGDVCCLVRVRINSRVCLLDGVGHGFRCKRLPHYIALVDTKSTALDANSLPNCCRW